jgi:hypothetical protein
VRSRFWVENRILFEFLPSEFVSQYLQTMQPKAIAQILGQPIRYQYIDKAGSPAFLEAVEIMKNRTKISALQQVLHTLELARLDLVEEANRTSE